MDTQTEVSEPQQTPTGAGAPSTPVVTLTQEEYDELAKKAAVSSQNYARLKKTEEELETIKAQNTFSIPSDPEAERVTKLEADLKEIKTKEAKREVLDAHPELKDKWQDLEQFRDLPENAGMNLRTAAKAFLVEKGLLDPQRRGLEKPTGGAHTPMKTGMSAEEVAHLRNTNYKEYTKRLMAGQIQIISE